MHLQTQIGHIHKLKLLGIIWGDGPWKLACDVNIAIFATLFTTVTLTSDASTVLTTSVVASADSMML